MALLFRSNADSAEHWRTALARAMPDLETRFWPEVGDPAEIDVALVWKPPTGMLASLPNLKMIASLGAGVDHIFNDPELPAGVPIVRLVDPYMVRAMTEYIVFQVLRLHRQDMAYARQQRQGIWKDHFQPNAEERRVGVLGLGLYGSDAALRLKSLGFDVAGWSRTPKTIEGVRCFAGEIGLREMLGQSEIVVCLLPLTNATENLLRAETFALMPRGAAIVNVGRGRHLVEEDLIPALDSGQLSAAALDVFRTEPLPASHPFWRHERISLTPHVAAATNPVTAAPIVAENIRRLREGKPLRDVVDPAQQY
jgi:glyoxylate/hydroxypyruvate reductase